MLKFCHSVFSLLLLSSSVFANISSKDLSLAEANAMSLQELLEVTIVSDLATGTALEEKNAPASLSIITAEQIRLSGARTFYEALEQVPGVHTYPGKAFAMKDGISIRGIQTITNPHVLIMIDGVSLGTGYYGSPAMFFKMPSSLIERIEVIRGPGSALYGADAFSGVINIISKQYENIENQVSARYGSFETAEGYTHLKTQAGALKLGMTASIVDTNGDKGRVIQEDGLKGAPFSLAPGPLETRYTTLYTHADMHYQDFDLNLMFSRTDDAGTASGAGQILDPVGEVNNKTYLIDLKHTNTSLLKDTTIKTNLAFTNYDINIKYNITPQGSPAPFTQGIKLDPGLKEDSYFLNTRFIYEGIDSHIISVGIGYRYSKMRDITQVANIGPGVTTPGVLQDLSGTEFSYMEDGVTRNNTFALLQDEYSISSQWSLISGVRYDYYDDFGSSFNPRLALIWQEAQDLTFKALYGRAFRAPSFAELYLRNNTLTLGNENLDPETIDTFEVIMDYRAPVRTKLNLYYYQARDLITYVDDPSPATTRTAQNTEGINAYGTEIELSYRLSEKIKLNGNYAYVKAEHADTKNKVEDIAPHQVFAEVEYKPSADWNVNTQYFYYSKRYRVDTDSRDALGADSIVNLAITKDNIIKGLDLTIAARNLFDSDYREPSDGKIAQDYPMQGLNVFAELKYRF